MSQSNPHVATLASRLKEALESAECKLLSGQGEIDEEGRKRLELIELILEMRYRHALLRTRKWLVILPVVLLLVGVILATVRKPEVQFASRTFADRVSFVVIGHVATDITGWDALIGGLTSDVSTDSATLTNGFLRSAYGHSLVSGRVPASIHVDHISLPDTVSITLTYSTASRRLQIHSECARSRGCDSIQRVAFVLGPPNRESTSFRSAVLFHSVEPTWDVSLTVLPTGNAHILHNVAASDFSFLDVSPRAIAQVGGMPSWTGSRGGVVHLPQLNRDVPVLEDQWLDIAGSGLRTTIDITADSGMSVSIFGRGRRLVLGDLGTRRDLRPSIFDLIVTSEGTRTVGLWAALATGLALLIRSVAAYWGRL